jgi:ABC-type transport system involved in multi-copper enzyme maturation permease subunit
MIRFAWRQFRTLAVIACGALAVIAVLFALTRPQLVHLYKLHETDALLNSYGSLENIERLLLVVPALIGVFWGAPLIARELEAGTHRLVWTQSVTRSRWLVVKLGLVGGASAALAGLLSWAVTWWSGPVDHVTMDRLSSPLVFGERGLVPLGYAVFAFALGVVLGLLLRRTVPAMAATLAVFVAGRLAFGQWVRPHLIAPVHVTVALTSAAIHGEFVSTSSGPLTVIVNAPHAGDWMVSSSSQYALNAAGKVVYGLGEKLTNVPASALGAHLAKLDLHVTVAYQPASRFWSFQIAETAIFLAVALALVAFCFWWVRRRLS